MKRKADEIADSEDEGDELASDDDFGLPDEDLFLNATAEDIGAPPEGQP